MDDATLDNTLPDDIVALKAMVIAATKRCNTAMQERDAITKRFDLITKQRDMLAKHADAAEQRAHRLEAALLKLRKLYYGPRADRFLTMDQLDQFLLEFGEALDLRPVSLDDVAAEDQPALAEAHADGNARRAKVSPRGRRDLRSQEFEHLEERRVEHDLDAAQKKCACCGEDRCRVSTQESSVLEYIPGHFERIVHVRHVYACKACDAAGDGAQVQTAELARGAKVFDRAMAGPGLLAFIAASKFAVYTPLNRLEDVFERAGVRISRGTMCVWMRDVAELLRPVYDLMARRVRRSGVVQTDDTVMPMQAPNKVKQARMWVYIGDEDNPYDVYDFTLSRSRDGPMKFLKDFSGTLVADAYGGYNGVVVDNKLTRAGCWAHARRKFVDAEKSEPRIAKEAARLIRGLFEIEAEIKGMSASARTMVREKRSATLLGEIESKLRAWQRELLPKHAMAEAVNYALNQWAELTVFAKNERVPIDNNASERDMKRVVLNRKNSLFVGNERGGETAAILSSLTATCKRHGADPERYIAQALVNVPHAAAAELERWLPDRWKVWNQERLDAAEAETDV